MEWIHRMKQIGLCKKSARGYAISFAINEPGSILSDEGLCSISIENQVSWLLTDLTFSTEGHCGDLAS